MSKSLAVIQSFYIPWKGYFDIINSVDQFILFDDMQYTKRSWINRNQIKTPQGLHWLTIPVQVKGRCQQSIKDTRIVNADWSLNHWETIQRNYTQAAHFKQYKEIFEALYSSCADTYISQINLRFIKTICAILNISTPISWSTNYSLLPGKTERLVDLCEQVGADVYLTGPAAQNYIQEELFREAGIELRYMDYTGYPEYPQAYPPFVHEVSILDLLFNTGRAAPSYMKSFPDDVNAPA
ncbi:WbqC family protein [bacterium]|nr:WbqC family protein [bacterium]MBU1652897.1 WbqC family protein [bacterium]MBU1881008.1 WbqC family protein [bacterium]